MYKEPERHETNLCKNVGFGISIWNSKKKKKEEA